MGCIRAEGFHGQGSSCRGSPGRTSPGVPTALVALYRRCCCDCPQVCQGLAVSTALSLRTVPPLQGTNCAVWALWHLRMKGVTLSFPHGDPGTGTRSLLLLSLLCLGLGISRTSLSSHLPEASKELRLCLQGLICSQALPAGIPTLFPPALSLESCLGLWWPEHCPVQYYRPGDHAIPTSLSAGWVLGVLGSSQAFFFFFSFSEPFYPST